MQQAKSPSPSAFVARPGNSPTSGSGNTSSADNGAVIGDGGVDLATSGTQSTLEEVKNKYKASIIEKCFDKFTEDKKERDGLVDYLISLKLLGSKTEFQEIIDSRNKGKFVKIFDQMSLADLTLICGEEKIAIEEGQQEILDAIKPSKFYKVEFDENMRPTVTPLEDDGVWNQSKGGLDKSRQFIVNNSGNAPSLSLFGSTLLAQDELEREVATEAKILEKGLRKSGAPKERRQYLVTINEKGIEENMDLIRQHNALEGDELRQYSTPFSEEQVRLMYAPLITGKDGRPLPAATIKNNLSKAASLNPSFGSFSANCQTNALLKLMRGLNIEESTIRQSVESMRRFDAPNMVKIQTSDEKYPSQNSVVFQAPNDDLAIKFGAALPPKYLAQSNTRDGNTLVVAVEAPKEVYHPAKRMVDPKTGQKRKPSEKEIAREEKITTGLPKIKTSAEIAALGEGNKFRKAIKQTIAKIRAEKTLENRTKSALKHEDLDGFRYSDPNRHNRPHITEKATPGNEIDGRNPDLLYEMMSDMLTRQDAKNVSHYFTAESSVAKPLALKETGTGAVVFLIGTSTAGKSTICANLQEQDSLLPPEERLNWQTWGDDMERQWLGNTPEGARCLKTANTPKGYNERTFDRAIKASKAGQSMILDTFLDHAPFEVNGKTQELVIWDHFKQYCETKNFTCPSKVIFLHLPVPELTKRIIKRNEEAESPGGDPKNKRGSWAFWGYAQLFGSAEKGGTSLGQNLHRQDIYEAIYSICPDEGTKFKDMADQDEAILLAQKESQKILKDLGFKDGVDSIALGTKGWKVDEVYDHAKMTTAQIVGEIDGLARQSISACVTSAANPTSQEQQSSTKKPLIIYVAETDHGDMSYSSLLEKIAKDCDAKGLKSQIFSEFPNQTDKITTQSWRPNTPDDILTSYDWQKEHLRNVPEQKLHQANTELLDKKLIPMGDLKGRGSMYDQTFEAIKQHFSGKSSIGAEGMEMYLNEIDDPDVLTLVKAHFEEMKEKGIQIPLDQRPFAFYDAIDGPTAIHFKILHEQMAQDVAQNLDPQTDVVIMIAGGPHIPGLASQLDEAFHDNKKIVVGNFKEASNPDSPEFDKVAMFNSGSPKSCAAISGKVIGFEVAKNNQAIIPDKLSKTLEDKAVQKQTSQQSWAQKMKEREQGKSKVNEL